jgi:cell division protein FtsL
MYRKWKNGTLMSDIVKDTGTKGKTWYKRFERMEKRHEKATNGDSSATKLAISSRKDDEKKFLFLFFIGVLVIAIVIVSKNLYEKYIEWKRKKSPTNSENNH